jgi:hypothetical protein
MSANSNNHFLNSQNRTCEPCRKRKIRCDKELPCSNCLHRGMHCVAQNRGRGRPMKLLDSLDRYEYNQNELEDSHDLKSFAPDLMGIPPLISTPEDLEDPHYFLLGTLSDIVKYELCPSMIKYFILITNLEKTNKQQDIARIIQNKLISSSTFFNYENVHDPDQINSDGFTMEFLYYFASKFINFAISLIFSINLILYISVAANFMSNDKKCKYC